MPSAPRKPPARMPTPEHPNDGPPLELGKPVEALDRHGIEFYWSREALPDFMVPSGRPRTPTAWYAASEPTSTALPAPCGS